MKNILLSMALALIAPFAWAQVSETTTTTTTTEGNGTITEYTPGSVIVVSPTVIASEATTKNQPPDIDIMVFQIRPGAANGASTRQKVSQGERRKWALTSTRSRGTVRSD